MSGALQFSYCVVFAWLTITSLRNTVAAPALPEATAIVNRTSRPNGRTVFLSGRNGDPIPLSPAAKAQSAITRDQFFNVYGHLFGISDARTELIPSAPQVDIPGHSHVTFNQVFKGVPVFTGMIKVHSNPRGEVTAANGHFQIIPANFDVAPMLGMDAAARVASAQTESAGPNVDHDELVIVDPGWYGDPPIGPHLAYYIMLSDAGIGLNDAFFVDAKSGKMLDRWTLTENVLQREVYDGQAARDLPGLLARAEGDPPVESPEDVNWAYDYIGDVHGYYFRAFGRDGLDGDGLRMRSTVNSTRPGCPNAFWDNGITQTVFCTRVVSDDVLAHEFTHGVTHFTAQLLYQNQSGQLNESFSDVFGEVIDLFNGNAAFLDDSTGPPWPTTPTGNGTDIPNLHRGDGCTMPPDYAEGVRWVFAEDSPGFNGILRDMWNPPCLGNPDRANSPLETCDAFDSGGVHSGSGIPNHAFAMLTDGKTFNGYTVRGIGPIKSAAVWYRALTTYLPIAPDFIDAYYAFNQAAGDLVGTFPNDPRTGFPSSSMFTTDDAMQVDSALRAVEMDTPGRCGQVIAVLQSDPPPACGRTRTIYSDDFENGAPGWTVENSQPPTPYDWALTAAPLPFERPGIAWFCADPGIGDCEDDDESAVHSLISPEIKLPIGLHLPRVRFTHYIASEGGWDGGQLKIRVNEGEWRLLPGSAFLYNPCNGVLNRVAQGSTNPLAGTEGWSGIGGKFGTSVAALERFARPGDTIQFRFDFGKDGCTGVLGWYMDDFDIYDCTDCDRNGRGDDNDLMFSVVLGPAGPVGKDTPISFELVHPPLAAEDVTMRVLGFGDLAVANIDEYFEVTLNGAPIGRVFDGSGNDCSDVPDVDTLTIDKDVFNDAVRSGPATLAFVGNEEVNPVLCDGTSYVRPVLTYRTTVPDANQNSVSDYCENCQIAQPPIAPAVTAANRYVVIHGSNPNRLTALLVTPMESTAVRAASSARWLNAPIFLPEPQDFPGPLVTYSTLDCEPAFQNWGALGDIHVSGKSIVPNAVYSVREIDVACLTEPITLEPSELEPFLSPPAELSTSPVWGDISSAAKPGVPDGKIDANDLSAIVDRFILHSQVLQTYQADLVPAAPDRIINISDIAAVLDAMHGFPFVPAALTSCPNNLEWRRGGLRVNK